MLVTLYSHICIVKMVYFLNGSKAIRLTLEGLTN